MEEKKTITNREEAGFRQFLTANRLSFIITLTAFLFAYGMQLFHVMISHDTEAIISDADAIYNSWLAFGRFGLVLLKRLLGMMNYIPYTAVFLFFVTMFATSVVWQYLFYRLTIHKERFAHFSWILPVIFFTAPIMAEQASFMLQTFEVTLGMLLLGVTLLCLWRGILDKRRFCYVPAVFCLVLAFSIYQALVPLFIAMTIGCFLLYMERGGKTFGVIVKLILSFVLSLVLYYIANKLVIYLLHIGASTYLEDQIMWGKVPVSECISNILSNIRRAVTARGIYLTLAYPAALLAALGLIILMAKRRTKKMPLYILCVLVLLLSPFFMTILMGNTPQYRTQLTLPFVCGFVLQYLLMAGPLAAFRYRKVLIYPALFLVALLGCRQGMVCARLFNTEYVVYQEDVRLAVKISDRIDKLDLGESPAEPVVFIGTRTPKLNPSTKNESELSGFSFYQIAFSTTHGTFEIKNFMDTLGYHYRMPTDAQAQQAESLSADMPIWPNNGSVTVKNGLIIVKLSDL